MPASNGFLQGPGKELLQFIKNGSCFIVAGHEEPDGDCIGSQLALSSLLRRLGKTAIPCSAGPFKRPEVKPYESQFLPCPSNLKDARVLVMDCPSRERVGDIPIDGLPLAVIDHHATCSPWGQAAYVDPKAPSVTIMIESLFRALEMEILPEEAELLFFGFCTDTGFFRHLEGGLLSGAAMEAAARLVSAGASPKNTFLAMNGGKSLNSRLLMGTVLAKTRPYYGGKLLVSSETMEETKQFDNESRDSDMIFQLLQSIEGVEAMALIRQETAEECTIGLRSRSTIDCAAITQRFGGGGHKNAAGAKVPGHIREIEEKLITAFAEWFN